MLPKLATMKKEIVKLKNKIINPNKFFRMMVRYCKKMMKIKNIYFLMPKQEVGNFVIKYSSNSLIMPIYLNDEIICLIVLKGRFNDNWFKANSKYLKKIKSIVEQRLGAVILYNRALERIIRNYQK